MDENNESRNEMEDRENEARSNSIAINSIQNNYNELQQLNLANQEAKTTDPTSEDEDRVDVNSDDENLEEDMNMF